MFYTLAALLQKSLEAANFAGGARIFVFSCKISFYEVDESDFSNF